MPRRSGGGFTTRWVVDFSTLLVSRCSMSPILTTSSPGVRRDRQPVAVAVEQLQPRLLGAEQQGDRVDVLMRAGADIGAVAGDRRIMEQAQHRIAVAHRVVEIVGREVEIARDRLEELERRSVSNAANSSRKVSLNDSHLLRPDVGRHQLLIAVPRRQLAADVPEFLEVEIGRALGGLDPERRVAARAAACRPGDSARFTSSGSAKKAFAFSSARCDQIGRRCRDRR